jgi:carbonic anhydrase
MACAPFNIVTEGAAKCALKCQFYYKYGNSSCQMVNTGTYLSITYDGTSDVVFNNKQYTPEEIRIYTPSVHRYADKAVAAEVIIKHKGNSGGLLVCVPVTKEGAASKGSELLSQLIKFSPSSSEGSKSMSLPDFNANFLIPSGRFYTYQHPFFDGVCVPRNYEYIVFHPRYTAVSLDADVLKQLQIASHNIETMEGAVSVNEAGTSKNGFAGDGQIYIDCQPTGHAEEEIVFKEPTQSKSWSPEATQMILNVFIGILAIVVAYVMLQFVLKKIQSLKSSS